LHGVREKERWRINCFVDVTLLEKFDNFKWTQATKTNILRSKCEATPHAYSKQQR